jgi:hypothetical protein
MRLAVGERGAWRIVLGTKTYAPLRGPGVEHGASSMPRTIELTMTVAVSR